jgi:trimeric autotransporter adhesin
LKKRLKICLFSFILVSLSGWSGLNAQSWTSFTVSFDGPVYGLYDSPEDTLYIGGRFVYAGGLYAGNIAAYRNGNLLQMGMPMGNDNSMLGTNGDVYCMQKFKDQVFVGGSFTTAEGFYFKYISYYAQGNFAQAGNVINNTVRCMAVYNGELYAGGDFVQSGVQNIKHIAKWNGTSWVPVKGGTNGNVRALRVYKDYLVAAGDFDSAGLQPAQHIAKWDGTQWSALGQGILAGSFLDSLGIPATINALQVYHGMLYAGGKFGWAGNLKAVNIARWDDNGWAACGIIGNRWTSVVKCFAEYDSMLVAGGYYESVNDSEIHNIASWNGKGWRALGTGTDSTVNTLAVHDYSLIAGGEFYKAGGILSQYIAQWRVHTTGVASENKDKDFTIFPNPTNGIVNFRLQRSDAGIAYNLKNEMGTCLRSGKTVAAQQNLMLDLKGLPPGVYYFSCKTMYNSTYTEKIVLVK